MKLPQVQRILREDIPEAPSWIAKLISPLNVFIDALYNGLNKNITFTENIDCQIKELAFTTSSTYVASDTWETISFKRGTKNKVNGVIILSLREDADYFTPLTEATSVSWQEIEGNVKIEFIKGLADSTSYKVKLLII